MFGASRFGHLRKQLNILQGQTNYNKSLSNLQLEAIAIRLEAIVSPFDILPRIYGFVMVCPTSTYIYIYIFGTQLQLMGVLTCSDSNVRTCLDYFGTL